jgi:hypothetical protein
MCRFPWLHAGCLVAIIGLPRPVTAHRRATPDHAQRHALKNAMKRFARRNSALYAAAIEKAKKPKLEVEFRLYREDGPRAGVTVFVQRYAVPSQGDQAEHQDFELVEKSGRFTAVPHKSWEKWVLGVGPFGALGWYSAPR